MNVLAVMGDYYHDEQLFTDALKKVISNLDNIEVTYTSRTDLLKELETYPDLVILASENRLNPNEEKVEHWMTEADAEKIAHYVENGGSWFAWHAGLASYDEVASYVDMLGGYFTHHPDEHAMVQYTYETHSLNSNDQQAFEISDEHYFINHTESIDVFLKSSSRDGESIAGWTKTYGKGRVACYTPAHKEEGLKHTQVQKDLEKLIEWCLG